MYDFWILPGAQSNCCSQKQAKKKKYLVLNSLDVFKKDCINKRVLDPYKTNGRSTGPSPLSV